MRTREYGNSGTAVVVLHGGPGISGYMAPVARRLAESFRVYEPLQRGSGDHPLTVDLHVADIHELVESRRGDPPPILVGHSWGAMLALAYAAAHPASVKSLALIACGTFDQESRHRMHSILESRTDDGLRLRMARLPQELPDADERLRVLGNLLLPLYSYDPASTELEIETCDARAHRESWEDMVRLQDAGLYPPAFAAIHSPVLMLHGAADPHPGRLIRASLEPHLPQLEYFEWERCGHYPWLEKEVRDEFFAVLLEWLHRQSASSLAGPFHAPG